MIFETVDNVYDYALDLVDRYPHATGIGIAVRELDGEPLAGACAIFVEADAGPIAGRTLPRGSRGLAAIRVVQATGHEIDRFIAGQAAP